ncbi:hypothetical protein [Methanocella sp. MCL-LM]|uniref:hypothetical protein n=1 Tax=Methanocella sp. MCL-LM TaxID=3412035 RepID=UPI003C746CD1
MRRLKLQLLDLCVYALLASWKTVSVYALLVSWKTVSVYALRGVCGNPPIGCIAGPASRIFVSLLIGVQRSVS